MNGSIERAGKQPMHPAETRQPMGNNASMIISALVMIAVLWGSIFLSGLFENPLLAILILLFGLIGFIPLGLMVGLKLYSPPKIKHYQEGESGALAAANLVATTEFRAQLQKVVDAAMLVQELLVGKAESPNVEFKNRDGSLYICRTVCGVNASRLGGYRKDKEDHDKKRRKTKFFSANGEILIDEMFGGLQGGRYALGEIIYEKTLIECVGYGNGFNEVRVEIPIRVVLYRVADGVDCVDLYVQEAEKAFEKALIAKNR